MKQERKKDQQLSAEKLQMYLLYYKAPFPAQTRKCAFGP